MLGASLYQVLQPLGILTGWTLVVEAWMFSTRIPGRKKYGVSSDPSIAPQQLQTKLPLSIRQIADNYNHLHEQPQVFYAVVLALALAANDDDAQFIRTTAWTYTGLRISHSLIQNTWNRQPFRFFTFAGSSLALAVLTARLLSIVFTY